MRLSDVADVVDGAQNDKLGAWMNTVAGRHPEHSAPAGRQRHRRGGPDQGAAAAAAGLAAPAIDVAVLTDRTITIRASVHDVEFELTLAVVLVVLVIFVFLRSVRGDPDPEPLGAAFAGRHLGAMYLFGFSLTISP